MEVAPLRVRGGAGEHRETVHRSPAEKPQRNGGEIKVRRAQNGFGTHEPQFPNTQEIPTADDPQAAFSQPDVARSLCAPPDRTSLGTTPPAQCQSFPQR